MNNRTPGWLGFLSLVTFSALMAAPLLWLVLTSLKTPEQMASEPYSWWPSPIRWQNYSDAVTAIPFFRYLANTLILCVGNVVGTLISCSLAAYAFARLRWPGRDVLFAVLIATMLLPWQVTMVPRFLVIRELGLYDTLGALIVPKFLGEAFYIFLLRQFFLTVPQSLIDAARLDGCSEVGILMRVMLPLCKPALLTVGLLEFVATWNDYGGPLLYLNDPERFPLAYGLEQFISSHSSELNLLLAAAVLFTLPIALLFAVLQRAFLSGIATTGMKG
ncbi:carbohydrate ABC transporter permease [Bythopirellula polymerisocia]|uniref:L-arabinose transport system permease protein AraQ n=1 Tax=Bythopirellula polymerisocia TaxID=2528003 RepID=A0A5C6CSP6_9BACT|nr:carbohydrate ABC transporter permease [Bythopirellula polymerisocia]TWU26116.1 L-arabinose transport system permease protein AraQ [Bythopirellula polymerisocia]